MTEINRRSVARGAAWAIPAMTVAAASPAVAASTACVASIDGNGQAIYNWGVTNSDPNTTATTTQTLSFSGALSLAGLPADAKITSISYTYWFQNRNDGASNPDGSTGAHGPGIYDLGNTHSSLNKAGTCSTSYSTVTGCRYTYGAAGSPLTAPTYGTSSTSVNPFTSGTATSAMTANWTNHTFENGKTTRAWSYTFTGDPSKAQALLTPDANGCLTLASQGTPVMNVTYSNVLQAAAAERTIQVDRIVYVTYTSGGQTYTLTDTGVNTLLCDSSSQGGVNAC